MYTPLKPTFTQNVSFYIAPTQILHSQVHTHTQTHTPPGAHSQRHLLPPHHRLPPPEATRAAGLGVGAEGGARGGVFPGRSEKRECS